MGFLQNLAEGFANAAGADNTVQAIEKNKADRRATQHEELEGRTHSILDDVRMLQQRRASLDPKSPTYAKDVAEIDANLHSARQAFTDLYHPEKNPGALDKLGGFIKSHLGKNPPPKTPAEARQRFDIAGLDAAAAGGGQTAPNPYVVKKQQMTEAGATPEEVQRGVFGDKPAPATKFQPQLTETTDGQGVKHYWRVPLEEGGTPEEVDFKGQSVTPKGAAGHSKFNEEAAVYEKQWGKKLADWSPEELSYFNQKMAYDAQRSGQSTTTRLEKDANGVIHPVEITSTRGPTKSPVDPHAVPRTPGQAKQRAAGVAPKSSVKEGAPLSFKGGTPAFNKAKTEYDTAVGLAAKADEVARHPNDAVNQKRLAVALERASAGRFTTQALDYILKAGWGNTIEQWANNPSTGALPTDIMRQLVDGAHQEVTDKKAALDAAQGGTDSSDDDFLKKF